MKIGYCVEGSTDRAVLCGLKATLVSSCRTDRGGIPWDIGIEPASRDTEGVH